MKATQHVVVSGVLGTVVGVLFRSVPAGTACFLSGVLLDLDHVPDYVLNYGARLDVPHFFKSFKRELLKHIIVFLHSWEWMILAAVVLWRLRWPPVGVGAFIGAVTHLGLDQLFNKHCAPAYFFTHRLSNGFAGRAFYGEKEYAQRLAAGAREVKFEGGS